MARATIRTIRTYPVPTDSLLPKLAAGCNQHLSTLVTYCPFYYWTRVDPRYPYWVILSILSSSKLSPPGGQFGPLLVISLLFNRTVAVCQSTGWKKDIYGYPLIKHVDQTSMFAHICWLNNKFCSFWLLIIRDISPMFEAKFLSRSSSFCLVSSNWWETCLSVQVRFHLKREEQKNTTKRSIKLIWLK